MKWGFPAAGGAVLLVYGGSQGSQAINEAVAEWIDRRASARPLRHLGDGRANHDKLARYRERSRARCGRTSRRSRKRTARPISRCRAAGAMATAELCAWGIPAIVVPLPTAAADHQTENAKALASAGRRGDDPSVRSRPESYSRQAVSSTLLRAPASSRAMRAQGAGARSTDGRGGYRARTFFEPSRASNSSSDRSSSRPRHAADR